MTGTPAPQSASYNGRHFPKHREAFLFHNHPAMRRRHPAAFRLFYEKEHGGHTFLALLYDPLQRLLQRA